MLAWASPCGCTGYVMRTVSAFILATVFCRRHTDPAAADRAAVPPPVHTGRDFTE